MSTSVAPKRPPARRGSYQLFHFVRPTGQVRGSSVYLVYSAHKTGPQWDDRVLLGSVVRSSATKKWEAIPYNGQKFLYTSASGLRTRRHATIALVTYLNRFKYGRERLDRANIHAWRTPR